MSLSKFSELCMKRAIVGYQPQVIPGKYDKIIIAMSSGVDSSLCAALFSSFPNVQGIYMQNWAHNQLNEDHEQEPCYEKDWKDVVSVAKHVNIPVERVNFEKDYWIDVFEPMLEQYNLGYTPNPDIGCNRFVKFGSLRKLLDKRFGENNYWLVTGHYARVLRTINNENSDLLKSYYLPKDQSYYLSQIDSNFLSRLLLPIGNLTKPEVRKYANEVKLPTAKKADSQGICFVNNSQHGSFRNFLKHYLPNSKGNIITINEQTGEKKVWGTHNGIWSYTLGQKIGLSMPQGDPNYQGTWYVSDKNFKTNEICIVRGRDHPSLYSDELFVNQFIPMGSRSEIEQQIRDSVKMGKLTIQYRSLQEPIKVIHYKMTSNRFRLKLNTKQRAIAPGQYCCFYYNEKVLGSGVICH